MSADGIKAILCDTFGTVVDWRGSIIADFRAFGRERGVDVDWEVFVDEWKTAYRPGMDAVRSGASPWMRVDAIYRAKLDAMLPKYGLDTLGDADRSHLVRVWHRLRPWPDSVAGLTRLRTKYVIAPLSNSDFDCLVAMAKHSALPWDAIFCAELFGHYKPDAEVYRGAVKLLGFEPREVMMVAAHNYDLREARSHGMRAAFVRRPTEYGPGQRTDLEAESDWDTITDSFVGLAAALGC